LCHTGACSTPSVVSSSATQLVLDAILTSGTWTAQVSGGGVQSNIFSFVVSPSTSAVGITGVTPSVPVASTTDQQITFTGSGLQQGLSLNLCLDTCFPPLSGAQIVSVATDGSSVTVLARLGVAGNWTASALNPDGSASQPFAFKVAAPITVSVNPVSGIVGQTQFTVTGTGASKNGIVDAASTFPDGTVHKFSSLADVQGNFSFGPFNQNQIGVYSEVYTDHTTGTNADPLKYTVSPSSGIPTVTGISPASPTANSATQQLTIGGSGFQAGAV